jgi:hypothetical protein
VGAASQSPTAADVRSGRNLESVNARAVLEKHVPRRNCKDEMKFIGFQSHCLCWLRTAADSTSWSTLTSRDRWRTDRARLTWMPVMRHSPTRFNLIGRTRVRFVTMRQRHVRLVTSSQTRRSSTIQVKPIKLPKHTLDSYEVIAPCAMLTFTGSSVAGAKVTIFTEGSRCREQLGSGTANQHGVFEVKTADFRASTRKDCPGEPFAGHDTIVINTVGYNVRLHVEDNTSSEFSVATEQGGVRSPCSEPQPYVEKTEEPLPATGTTVGLIHHEPGSLYGFQIAGQARSRRHDQNLRWSGVTGNDLTRVVSTFNSGAFVAWIDVPNHTHLRSLGLQTTHEDVVTCQDLPADIATSDDINLQIDPIVRTRRDDASVDVTLSGTAHAKDLEVYLGEGCTGDAVASTTVSTADPSSSSASAIPDYRRARPTT